MREIDFLPQWYKHECSQNRKHREYYIAIGLILVIMVAWSIFANGRVAVVKAKNQQLQQASTIQSQSSAEYSKAQANYALVKAKVNVLESIETKMKISNVLAELTHLLGSRVVLNKFEIKTEPFKSDKKQQKQQLRVYGQNGNTNNNRNGKFRYSVIISGVAAGAAEVAQLISSLEDSDYFMQVIPGYSRNVTIAGCQGSEFEISCYLANYKVGN
ncbi:MAG: hypothetical protein K8R02_05360 [Anaerohalosphaeraceae bacterium]|nr:hypothetical protein [Anaerohalosphaeraceae bacterium]